MTSTSNSLPLTVKVPTYQPPKSSQLSPSKSLHLTPPSTGSIRQADSYLSELLSCSLDRLRKEPDLLREEKEQLERNIQNAAVVQYTAFISAANCLKTISHELSNVGDHLSTLLQTAPELANICEAFASESSIVMEQYALNKQLAGNQSTLLELLEIPQLMDTCVRNGIYDEALDLQAFVNRLGLLHPHIPAVKVLLEQVSDVGQTMLSQLLTRLKSNLQLPECLRIMGYLRRIAAYTEEGLRLQFLQCRDEWISGLIDELENSDSYEYVKHLTDIHRLHLFDAVMQYRAIFFDNVSSQESSLPNIKETGMLYSWVQHRITIYIDALEAYLPAIVDGGNLASVLENCLYCGSSLSRVGMDFQGLLQPVFEAAAMGVFMRHMNAARDAFSTRLENHRWVPLPPHMAARQRDMRGMGSTDDGAESKEDGADGLAPPYMLMDHLPLAVLTNGILAAFNELRHCAMLGLCRSMASALQSILEHVATSLSHYPETHMLNDSERPLFLGAVQAMHDVLLPYFATSFARVFSGVSVKLDISSPAAILKKVLVEF